MSCRQPDDENRFHRDIDRHGRLIRWLAVAVMMVAMGLLCSSIGEIAEAVDRLV